MVSSREVDPLEKTADYYSLLGVVRKATPEEIKRAYRKMVFRYHPDRNPNDEEAAGRLKQIMDAYTVLSDETQRAEYDKATWSAFENDNGDNNGERTDGFRFSHQFKQKLAPEPHCPDCAAVGMDHIISRKAGSGTSRGKQFVTSPFQVVFCGQCGHVYGIAGHSS
ncbi:MAG: J domain-containing protein [Candidatus Binatia bacterium]